MKLSCARGSETHVRGSTRKRLRKQTLIVRPRKGRGRRLIHHKLVVAEARGSSRKQSQLTLHPRKLKRWSRKQRGRQVGLEEIYIGFFRHRSFGHVIHGFEFMKGYRIAHVDNGY